MRLFIAIRFSPAVGRRLCEAMESLGRQALSAGLTRPENLHLTLAFIGEADDIGPICRVMDASAPPGPIRITVGGAAIRYEDGSVKSIKQLESVSLTDLTEFTATASNQRYDLDENVQVYLRDSSGDLHRTSLSEIIGSDYSLRGWYDDLGYAAGGLIRIIVAS